MTQDSPFHPPQSQDGPTVAALQTRRAPARLRYPFESLRKEIDRFIHDFDHAWSAPAVESIFSQRWPDLNASMVTPLIDIIETESAYELHAELSGLAGDEIEVTIADGILQIKGEKLAERTVEKADAYVLHERQLGGFERSFRIPDGVDSAKITASTKNGLLTVTLPRTTPAKGIARTIRIAQR